MPEGYIFLKSIIVGLGIAAPVGPVGVLCVRRTITGGPILGLSSGLGAACADAVYGAIAAFGLGAVGAWLIGHDTWIRLVGGTFLVALGAYNLLSGPRERRGYKIDTGALWGFVSTMALTLSNPITLLSFAAIFAAVGLTQSGVSMASGLQMVTGVFLGSAAWWLGLSGAVLLLRHRVTSAWMTRIHYGAGAILVGFGLYAFLSVIL